MSEPTTQHQVVEDLLDRVVTAYLKRRDQGEQPDRQAILAGYPHLADRLEEFFGNQDTIEQHTAGLRQLYASLGKETPAEVWPRVDDYQIEKEIARGGMGVVYRARQVSLNRVVALKMVLAGEFASQQAKERFQEEAEAAAGLEHPNIVPIYQVGSHHGQPFLTMKFIDGPPLSQAIAGLSDRPREVARLMARTARAVHSAHQHGILHRDLKPGNILLDRDGVPHVTDFGLAKKMESNRGLTQTGAIVGTPSYIAPEQARAEKQLTTAADVYALGAILYECLTGQPPHHGETPMDTLYLVMHEQPIAPRWIRARIDRNIETICLKCLEKEPTRRYGSAEAVAEDLERWLVGEPIQARPVSAAVRTWSWARRRPAVAALAAVSFIATLALVGSVVGLAYSSRLHEALHKAEQARQGEAEARKQAELFQYFHHIGQAHTEWERNGLSRMAWMLENCPTDRRNWEWQYLKRLSVTELRTIRAHKGSVMGMAFSPDGTRFVSAGDDKIVKVWDATTSEILFTYHGHSDIVNRVAFSPDGRHLASASTDTTVRLWDAGAGQEGHILHGHTETVFSVAFSPDGTRVASASFDKTVRLWDVTTGKETLTLKGHTDRVSSVAFSPDGRYLVSAGVDQSVRVWNVKTGLVVRTLKGHTGVVFDVAFSPDGTRLASAGFDRTVRLWDIASGQALGIRTGSIPWAIRFSPDGTFLALADENGLAVVPIRHIESRPEGEARSPLTHRESAVAITFSPDGARLLSGDSDGTIKMWAVRDGLQPLTLRGHAKGILNLAFSPDGTRLASGSRDRTVRVWDVTTGQETLACKGHKADVHGVAFSPDGSRLASASADKTVCVWNTTTGGVLQTYLGHTGTVFSVAFSHDGTRLASASADRTVKLWDMTTGKEALTLKGHTGDVNSVVFSPDDNLLTTASSDQLAKVWDATSGKSLLTFSEHYRPVHCAVFSPDGQRIASGNPNQIIGPGGDPRQPVIPGKVIVWDAKTGRAILALRGHAAPVNSVAFSPNGTRLASASDDRTVRVWDATTGESLLTLQGHTGAVNSVAFSPDGARLASASEDGTIRIWDARPLTPEIAIERESVALLEFLFSRPLCKTDVIEYLNNSPTIRPETRQKALALAKHYREQNDPEVYHQASRALSRQPYLNVFQYRFALRQAETACRLAPGSGKHLTALAVTKYRLGQYQAALRTLTRADQINKGAPVDLAFTAMAQYRLGQKEMVQSTVNRLRTAMKRPEWAQDSEARDSMREAEAMISGMKTESRK